VRYIGVFAFARSLDTKNVGWGRIGNKKRLHGVGRIGYSIALHCIDTTAWSDIGIMVLSLALKKYIAVRI
jgi:hypothetical protein